MGFHVYCAVCGSTFSGRGWISIDSDDDADCTYRGEVIGDSDLSWLEHVRALGLNPHVAAERKSFLTGEGYHDDADAIYAYAGQDPNVPTDPDEEPPYFFCAYWDYMGNHKDKPVFPFHKACYEEILLRCFKDEIFNGDILYSLFEELVHENAYRVLLLDYGEPIPLRDQYWESRKGEELLVTNPVEIPRLSKYLDELQVMVKDEMDTSRTPKMPVGPDIFDTLPQELRVQIFDLLPIASVLALKAASWSMHTVHLPRRSLETDLPWLWEIHDINPFRSQKLEARLSKVIAELEEQGQYTKETVDYIPGLVNRKRIWMVCENIKDLYHNKVAESKGHVLHSSAPLAICRANLARNN
ncbi:hypothetical protein BDV39DRAFT_206194 [Aspergillus sergii]|uniref:F-box domain-containing protein n=1 Tax=Aspergillus sergii TaxID=1034303 RepID=A0A5N6X084_9EURO|nr:hypothetical protein BDV39DRAFT_206194 [Aspergillus sergii]